MSEKQQPRTDNESLIHTPGGKPEDRKGVRIMSGKTGEGGVERLSVREPGELETTVETALQGDLTSEGRKNWK